MTDDNIETVDLKTVNKDVPLYRSHKTVRALEIESLYDYGCTANRNSYVLTFADSKYPSQIVQEDMITRYRPVKGDFYVIYEDGYRSFSPRKAFLEGYTLVKSLILVAGLAASLVFAPPAARAALAAQAEEDPVNCTINGTSFWTTHSVCDPLLDEARLLIGKYGSMSRSNMLHRCADDMAKKLPGSDRPTYLNGCEQLLRVLFPDGR